MSSADQQQLRNISNELTRIKGELESVANLLDSNFVGISSDIPASRLRTIATNFGNASKKASNHIKEAEEW